MTVFEKSKTAGSSAARRHRSGRVRRHATSRLSDLDTDARTTDDICGDGHPANAVLAGASRACISDLHGTPAYLSRSDRTLHGYRTFQ